MPYSSWGTYRIGRTYHLSDEPGPRGRRECCSSVFLMILLTVFLVMVPLMSWGAEKEFHDRLEAFFEVEDDVVACTDNDPKMKDCLGQRTNVPVHLTSTSVSGSVQDEPFGVSLQSALGLVRATEYCQWEEHSTEKCETCTVEGENGKPETTKCNCVVQFHYVKSWRSHRINSLLFDQPAAHHNPQRDPYPSTQFYAKDARAGKVPISYDLLNNPHQAFRAVARNVEWNDIAGRERQWYDFIVEFFGYVPGARDRTRYEHRSALRDSISSEAAKQHKFVYVGRGGFFYSPYEMSTYEMMFKYFVEYLEGSLLDWQLGDIVPSCKAGDIRVHFKVRDPSSVSVIGAPVAHPNGKMLGIFKTSKKYELGIVHEGIHTPYEMFDREAWEAKKTCLWMRAALLLWGLVPAHIIAAFFGRRMVQWMHKLAASICVTGIVLAGMWLYLWKEKFGEQLQDAVMIGLFIMGGALGWAAAQHSEKCEDGHSGFWAVWVWICILTGAPREWRILGKPVNGQTLNEEEHKGGMPEPSAPSMSSDHLHQD